MDAASRAGFEGQVTVLAAWVLAERQKGASEQLKDAGPTPSVQVFNNPTNHNNNNITMPPITINMPQPTRSENSRVPVEEAIGARTVSQKAVTAYFPKVGIGKAPTVAFNVDLTSMSNEEVLNHFKLALVGEGRGNVRDNFINSHTADLARKVRPDVVLDQGWYERAKESAQRAYDEKQSGDEPIPVRVRGAKSKSKKRLREKLLRLKKTVSEGSGHQQEGTEMTAEKNVPQQVKEKPVPLDKGKEEADEDHVVVPRTMEKRRKEDDANVEGYMPEPVIEKRQHEHREAPVVKPTRGLEECTVAELQAMCRKEGLKIGGRKDELIARVRAALESQDSLPKEDEGMSLHLESMDLDDDDVDEHVFSVGDSVMVHWDGKILKHLVLEVPRPDDESRLYKCGAGEEEVFVSSHFMFPWPKEPRQKVYHAGHFVLFPEFPSSMVLLLGRLEKVVEFIDNGKLQIRSPRNRGQYIFVTSTHSSESGIKCRPADVFFDLNPRTEEDFVRDGLEFLGVKFEFQKHK